MIQLALELPTAYLEKWTPMTDLDFCLAHKILADDVYAAHYAGRPRGRLCIMDNSMHELGGIPLKVEELAAAAEAVHADVIIAPDKLGELDFNKSQFNETAFHLSDKFRIGAVLCGRGKAERQGFLRSVSTADVLLLPFREPRLAWYEENALFIHRHWNWIHLLGINELAELDKFRGYSLQYRDMRWSVDTGKAVKHGVAMRSLDSPGTLRGAKLHSNDLLDLKDLSELQVRQIEENIQLLRAACA